MYQKLFEQYEVRANIFKAIGHPARLFIMEVLKNGERCVSDLAKMLKADSSTVSKHLDGLKNAGILESHRRGSNVFYSLATPCIVESVSCAITCAETVIKERAAKQMKISKFK